MCNLIIQQSGLWRGFIDLKILNLNVLFHVLRQHLNNLFFVRLQPDIRILVFYLFASQPHIFASAEICLKVMNTICDVVEHNQCAFFLIEGIDL